MKDSIFDIQGKDFYPATDSGYMGVVMYEDDGVYYHYRSHDAGSFSFSETGVTVSNLPLYSYNGSSWDLVGWSSVNFEYDDILIQTYRSEYPKFYAQADVSSGNVAYSYSSSAFAAMETKTPLDEVISILPVCFPVLIMYAAIRKGFSWIRSLFKNA